MKDRRVFYNSLKNRKIIIQKKYENKFICQSYKSYLNYRVGSDRPNEQITSELLDTNAYALVN